MRTQRIPPLQLFSKASRRIFAQEAFFYKYLRVQDGILRRLLIGSVHFAQIAVAASGYYDIFDVMLFLHFFHKLFRMAVDIDCLIRVAVEDSVLRQLAAQATGVLLAYLVYTSEHRPPMLPPVETTGVFSGRS